MSDLERAQRELAELTAQAAELEQRRTSTDLVRINVPAEEVQAQIEAMKHEAERQQVLVRAKVAEVRALAEQQREELLRVQREAERALEPIKRAMRGLQQGLTTIGLYLGTGERIERLRDGEPAPAETPISIRQMVLRMDEECAAAAEEGGIDAVDFSAFDEWLLADDAHVQQVLPESKGVVCLTPRHPHRSKRYSDSRMEASVEKANRQTYWLIRNGEQLWRTTTDDFEVPERLVPGPSEFTDLFTETERRIGIGRPTEVKRVPIRPGTRAWDEAQERAEAAELHYFRVALILEGLLHRTPIFEPQPTQGLSFLDPRHHEAGRVRFILDAEAALGDGHEPFRDWQRRLNAQLRPGLRIVGHFSGYYGGLRSYDYKGDSFSRGGNSRLHPASAERPKDGVIYTLEHVQGGRLGFKYERTEKVWDPDAWVPNPERPGWGHRGEYRAPKQRASCVVDPTDDWVIPFDLATEEEMVRFLHARTDRREYVEMFPVLKAAIRAKRVEAVEEAPFRTMLAGVLARENGVSVAEAERDVSELVEWFKTANRWHRPLADKTEMGAKAVRLITAEHARRVRIAQRRPSKTLVRQLRESFGAVMVGRRRSDGRYVVVAPERSDEEVWARVITWGVRKGVAEDERWQTISKAQAARWEVLWAHDRWMRWDLEARPERHLTDPERDELIASVKRRMAEGVEKRGRRPKPGHERGRAAGDAQATGLLAVTDSTREGRRELVAWYVAQQIELPDAEHPLTKPTGRDHLGVPLHGRPLQVEGQAFLWERGMDGKVTLRHGGGVYSSGRYISHGDLDRLGESEWTERNVMLWRDRELIDRLKVEQAEYRHRKQRADALGHRTYALVRAIRAAWVAAWWEQRRQEFVGEYGKPELWDGQRKVIESERRRSDVASEAPLGGLYELVAHFVEAGEDDAVWGRTVADVLNEAVGRGWAELEPEDGAVDASLLALRFEREADEEDDDEAPEWEADEDFEADGRVVLPELESGDIVDAEVIE